MTEMETKIAELMNYFTGSRPEVSVHTNWDFDRRCWAFRFDENHRFYLLKFTHQVLDDYKVSQVIELLEKANWRHVLDGLQDGGAAIFTSQGLKPEGSST